MSECNCDLNLGHVWFCPLAARYTPASPRCQDCFARLGYVNACACPPQPAPEPAKAGDATLLRRYGSTTALEMDKAQVQVKNWPGTGGVRVLYFGEEFTFTNAEARSLLDQLKKALGE